MAAEVILQPIGEKALHQPVNPGLLAYCPSMELLALGSTDNQILIYRLNGQRVYGATQKGSKLHVNQIEWKPNGQLLAIAWSDGVVRLVGAESSKTVHQISTATKDGIEITCLGWVSNFIRRKSSRAFSQGPKSWKDLLQRNVDSEDLKPSLDLPRDLSLIDIESSMPHLSTLPAGATAEDIFSSREALDGIFRPFDPKDNEKVDVMVVGTADGRIHLSIYDSFVLGFFPSPLPSSRATNHQLILHASHRHYSTHSLLLKSASTLVRSLHFIPMDLRFITTSSDHLSVLASRSTTLQNLLRYIDQVNLLMVSEYQATQDLPSRFLGNINETLAEQQTDIVTAMYHSVVTGDTFPSVKEWLVDDLAERGHKRWDKAVTTGLESLRRLVHEHMQPALERCGVILSRLLGIAKFQGVEADNAGTGFSPRQISLVMDTVACLNLVSMRILMYVVEEIDLFSAFSTWLRYEIDRLASDSAASPSDEQVEKEAGLDHVKVLSYIQNCLTRSRLAPFFRPQDDPDIAPASSGIFGSGSGAEHAHRGLPLFDIVDTQLRKHDMGEPFDQSLMCVKTLFGLLQRQAEGVFIGIAEAERRNVLFGEGVDLRIKGEVGAVAMRVVAEDEAHSSTYIAVVEGHIIHLYHILLRLNNGVSTRLSCDSATISLNLPASSKIIDLAFLDDFTLLILSSSSAPSSSQQDSQSASNDSIIDIQGIPYRHFLGQDVPESQSDSQSRSATQEYGQRSIVYTPFLPSSSAAAAGRAHQGHAFAQAHTQPQAIQDISSLLTRYTISPHHTSSTDDTADPTPFIPAKMEVRPVPGAAATTAASGTSPGTGNEKAHTDTVRIVLLEKDGKRYRVFGLASTGAGSRSTGGERELEMGDIEEEDENDGEEEEEGDVSMS